MSLIVIVMQKNDKTYRVVMNDTQGVRIAKLGYDIDKRYVPAILARLSQGDWRGAESQVMQCGGRVHRTWHNLNKHGLRFDVSHQSCAPFMAATSVTGTVQRSACWRGCAHGYEIYDGTTGNIYASGFRDSSALPQVCYDLESGSYTKFMKAYNWIGHHGTGHLEDWHNELASPAPAVAVAPTPTPAAKLEYVLAHASMGDVLECTTAVPSYLTVGKMYTVVDDGGGVRCIIDDDGDELYQSASYFINHGAGRVSMQQVQDKSKVTNLEDILKFASIGDEIKCIDTDGHTWYTQGKNYIVMTNIAGELCIEADDGDKMTDSSASWKWLGPTLQVQDDGQHDDAADSWTGMAAGEKPKAEWEPDTIDPSIDTTKRIRDWF